MVAPHLDEKVSPVISTSGLTKSYRGKTVLSSLNLTVQKNSILGFLGPNGAGKTTTIKLLLGLARPTSGGATVFGSDILADSVEIRTGYYAQFGCVAPGYNATISLPATTGT